MLIRNYSIVAEMSQSAAVSVRVKSLFYVAPIVFWFYDVAHCVFSGLATTSLKRELVVSLHLQYCRMCFLCQFVLMTSAGCHGLIFISNFSY